MIVVDNITCIVIILLIIGALWIFGSGSIRLRCGITDGSNENYSHRYPSSYYDQGGWIDHPPQISSHILPDYNMVYPSYNDPHPYSKRTPDISSNNLCQECLGYCQLKLWAGIAKSNKEKNEKDGDCLARCKLECGVVN